MRTPDKGGRWARKSPFIQNNEKKVRRPTCRKDGERSPKCGGKDRGGSEHGQGGDPKRKRGALGEDHLYLAKVGKCDGKEKRRQGEALPVEKRPAKWVEGGQNNRGGRVSLRENDKRRKT